MKRTVVFDFDGVIHSYVSGWKGVEVIPDEPVEGIKEAIREIRKAGYYVTVVSSRAAQAEGAEAIRKYLDKYGIQVDLVSSVKLPAICYIDDRAICFDGDASSLLAKIRSFKPWNK
ncbi:hypothetical protein [Clostridium sp. Marseille-P2415]|uniref:hypothetical protein n=1 Tax=Clostridium sp. Marseille-P2415 TaxID=1805471 RepID=UPI000988428B|nr:hypothetical protein [Clostridium sp. Marseille-P2415]